MVDNPNRLTAFSIFEARKLPEPPQPPTSRSGRDRLRMLPIEKLALILLAENTAMTVRSHNFVFEKQPLLTVTRSEPQFRHRFLSRGFDGPLYPSAFAELMPEFATSGIVAEILAGSKRVATCRT